MEYSFFRQTEKNLSEISRIDVTQGSNSSLFSITEDVITNEEGPQTPQFSEEFHCLTKQVEKRRRYAIQRIMMHTLNHVLPVD